MEEPIEEEEAEKEASEDEADVEEEEEDKDKPKTKKVKKKGGLQISSSDFICPYWNSCANLYIFFLLGGEDRVGLGADE